MKKSLNQIDGTIANYLVKHKDEIWACGNDTTKMKQTVLNLLKSKELEHNSHTSEAIKRFYQTTPPKLCRNAHNLYAGLQSNLTLIVYKADD